MNNKISIKNIEAIFFDFDGVLTNNKVYVDQYGKEAVECNRSDGIAFEILNKLKIDTLIISTEKNRVVKERAKKIKIKSMTGVSDKSVALKKYVKKKNLNFKKIMYIGNDINDYSAMKLCGFSACPNDSHKEIKKIAKIKLKCNGGEGVARELLEKIFQIKVINYFK